MKSNTKTRGLLLFLVIFSLAITGSGAFAYELNPVYSEPPALAVNAALFVPDYGLSSGSLSIMGGYMASVDYASGNENDKGVARNFSSVRTFIPAKSSLITQGTNSDLFNLLQKSFQDHPPSRYYFDSSPLYCSGGY